MLSWFHLVCMGQKYAIIYMYYSNGNNILYRVRFVPQGHSDLDCYIGTMYPKNSLSMDHREPISVHKYNYLSMLAPTGKIPLSKHRSFFYQAFLRKYDSFKLITHFLGFILLSCQHIYTCISKEMFFCIYLVALFIETDKCSNLKLYNKTLSQDIFCLIAWYL